MSAGNVQTSFSQTGAGILIIGAGQAGAMAVSALRQCGFAGPITLVGDEHDIPYERPPLSKSVLLAPENANSICIHPDAYYREHSIALRLGTRVLRLEPQQHRAVLADGATVQYEKCLIATGGRVRELKDHPVGSSPRLHYIRTLTDARALRNELHALANRAGEQQAEQIPLLVLGAGFLGLEVASSALQLGLSATVVEAGHSLLARAVPPMFSVWLSELLQIRGLALRLGAGCDHIQEGASGMHVCLSDGLQLNAACVVAAVGQHANTALAVEAGLRVCPQTGGILIDDQGRSSVPDVWAAGDCTTQMQPFLGKAVRLESWQSANEQARIAAASMTATATAPAPPPWFWTDMFDMNIQMMGLPQSGLRYFVRGAMLPPARLSADADQAPKFLLLGMDDAQRLRYVLAVNAGGDLRVLRTLLVNENRCDPAIVCDASRSLREIVKHLQTR